MARFLKRLVLIGGLVAAAAYVKSLLEEPEPDRVGVDTEPSGTAPSGQSVKPSPSDGTPGASKQELYRRAQELDIPGRSKMSKAELERAIEDARADA